MSRSKDAPRTSEEFFAESRVLNQVQEMQDPIEVQKNLVLEAQTTEDIGKLIEEKKISLNVGTGGVNIVQSNHPKVQNILKNFVKNEALTDKWKPKNESDIDLKKELVVNAIETSVKRDIYEVNEGKQSNLQKEIPSTSEAVKAYIEEKIESCNNEVLDEKLNTRMDYKDPSILLHLMKNHPKCISEDKKEKILKLEANYQEQEFGDLIKNERRSKGYDQPFSKHEKAAMRALYEQKNKSSNAAEEYKVTEEDVHKALVEARSKTVRGMLTNIKRIGFAASIKAAVMSNTKSKKSGRSI
ncbi:MAG: hypothetical protein N4A31_04120 [Rickettsiales bacterium]|jgi:hypothetical protein|nr:hypothetical protein [Rickettsiales bacterium]